jgi:hypothetical protein
MPDDVIPPASSTEDQRTEAASQADNEQPLDPAHQEMADSPILKDLIEKLAPTDGAPSDDNQPPVDDDDEKPPADEPPADDPADDKTTDDAPPAEGPPAEKPPADDKPAEKPKPAVDDSYPTDKEIAGYSSNSQQRIRQLVAARKRVEAENAKLLKELDEIKPAASYRKDLDETLTKHKIAPKAWDEWSSLGVLIQTDPAKAGPVLLALADSLGFKPATGTPPAKGEKVTLDPDLAKLVADNEMTEEAAQAIQRKLARPPAAPTNTESAPLAPRLAVDPVKKGAADIAAVNAEYEKRYPDQWKSWAPEVMAEMAKYAGSAPHLWKQIATDCAEKVIAKKASKRAPVIDPVARSSGGRSSIATGGPPKNREEMAERIVAITAPRR